MKGLCLVLAVGILCLMMPPAHAEDDLKLRGIKGEDDRTLEETRAYPWSAIGRLNIAGVRRKKHCTGTLIGARVVLTAAHCVWNSITRRYHHAGSIHFLPGFNRGDFLAHSVGTRLVVSLEYKPDAPYTLENSAADWAFLELEKPLGQDVGALGLGGQGTSDFPAGRALIQAGYSKDKANILTVNDGCVVTGFTASTGLFRHTCDAVKGDSGSPVFVKTDAGYEIIGIHVATRSTGAFSDGIALAGTVYLPYLQKDPAWPELRMIVP